MYSVFCNYSVKFLKVHKKLLSNKTHSQEVAGQSVIYGTH